VLKAFYLLRSDIAWSRFRIGQQLDRFLLIMELKAFYLLRSDIAWSRFRMEQVQVGGSNSVLKDFFFLEHFKMKIKVKKN